MARKCLLNRNAKILNTIDKYASERKKIKILIKQSRFSNEIKKSIMKYVVELDSLPRNGSKIRYRRRCIITGRARSMNNYDIFGMCSFKIREKANNGEILGLKKF